MSFDVYSAIVGAVTAALPLATYIVHKTKTRKDDKVLEWIESILPLLPKGTPAPPSPATRSKTIDHR